MPRYTAYVLFMGLLVGPLLLANVFQQPLWVNGLLLLCGAVGWFGLNTQLNLEKLAGFQGLAVVSALLMAAAIDLVHPWLNQPDGWVILMGAGFMGLIYAISKPELMRIRQRTADLELEHLRLENEGATLQ